MPGALETYVPKRTGRCGLLDPGPVGVHLMV